MTGLTSKQEAFVVAVVAGANASDAYRSAYNTSSMCASTIWREAHALTIHPKVAARLEELRAGAFDAAGAAVADRGRLLMELSRVATADIREIVTWDAAGEVRLTPSDELSDAAVSQIAEVKHTRRHYGRGDFEDTVTVKLQPKMRAIELLGKELGMFADNVKIAVVVQYLSPLIHQLAAVFLEVNTIEDPEQRARAFATKADALAQGLVQRRLGEGSS